MVYTLKQAAEAAGKGKPAILKAIKNGRVSANKNDKGQWEIDPAELHRVYPPVPGTSSGKQESERQETPNNTRELELEVKHLNEKVAMLERERDAWQKQADRVTLLLTDQSKKSNSGAVERVKNFLWGNASKKQDKAPTA